MKPLNTRHVLSTLLVLSAVGSPEATMERDIESIDLAALARNVSAALGGASLQGYLRGRTVIRDAVARELECSDVVAENVVETMIGRGLLRFDGDPATITRDDARWTIDG